MRHSFSATLLLVFSCLMGSALSAAEQSGEPEFLGVVAARNVMTGEYVQLERSKASPEYSTSFLGLGAGGGAMAYPGQKSPVRFKSGEQIELVIRVERQDADPLSVIRFFSLNSLPGKRTLPLVASGGAFSGKITNVTDAHAIPFSATKMGTTFYKFSASASLPPGEYLVGAVQAFGTNSVGDFCFGIDP